VPDDIPLDRAVVDQIVDGHIALLLVGPSEDPLHVPVAALPDGAAEGSWVVLDLSKQIVGIDHELTLARASEVAERMERVRRERGGGRFGT
jgi:hypothetical protein